MRIDLIIESRNVFTGVGDVARPAAIAIAGDRIVAVGSREDVRAFALEALDGGQLVLGEAVGLHLDDAGLGGDVARGLGMVAGEQHRLDAQRADAAHGGFGRGSGRRCCSLRCCFSRRCCPCCWQWCRGPGCPRAGAISAFGRRWAKARQRGWTRGSLCRPSTRT